jgi:hypothetical protein
MMRAFRFIFCLAVAGAGFWSCQDDRVVAPSLSSFPVGEYTGVHEELTFFGGLGAATLSQPIAFTFAIDGTFQYKYNPGPADSLPVFSDVFGKFEVRETGLLFKEVDSNFTRCRCGLRPTLLGGLWTVDTTGREMTLYQEVHDPANQRDSYQWLRLTRGR